MSLRRRLQLLEWAQKSGALIFEDDYDSEYRYSGRPIPALQGLDRSELVLFAGSFSKVLFPSLRLGYLVIPWDLVPYFATTKSVVSRHAPLVEQAVLCDFKEGLQLGFAAVDAAEIRRGIRELAIALEGESRDFPRRRCREGPRRLAEKSS
jgi:GntR family transcriptional regulator/MocR family aminotransferase